jgi:aminomethyltransferase
MEGVWKARLVTGAQPVHEPALEAFRIAGGIPRFGQDIRARDLPQETGQERALNFNKGCYIGQEIVERIRARGAIHRTLAGFEIAGSVPAPGSKVQQDGRDVGEITSIVRLPFEGGERLVGMGYLRKEFMASDKLKSGDASVRFAKLPFTELIETFQK